MCNLPQTLSSVKQALLLARESVSLAYTAHGLTPRGSSAWHTVVTLTYDVNISMMIAAGCSRCNRAEKVPWKRRWMTGRAKNVCRLSSPLQVCCDKQWLSSTVTMHSYCDVIGICAQGPKIWGRDTCINDVIIVQEGRGWYHLATGTMGRGSCQCGLNQRADARHEHEKCRQRGGTTEEGNCNYLLPLSHHEWQVRKSHANHTLHRNSTKLIIFWQWYMIESNFKGAVSLRFSQGLLTLMCKNLKLKAKYVFFFFFVLRKHRSKIYNWLQNFMIQHPGTLFVIY